MENGDVAVVGALRAEGNDDVELGFGEGEFRRLKDSEADEVFAMGGGDENMGKPQEMESNGNADDGREIETSEEAMHRPAEGNGEIVLDSLFVQGSKEEIDHISEMNRVGTDAVAKKGKGGDPEAFAAAVENGEIEKSENGEMNSGASQAVVCAIVEDDGIEENLKPNGSHTPQKIEEVIDDLAADQRCEDGVIAVKERTEDIDFSHHVDENGAHDNIINPENLEVFTRTKLNGVAGEEDGGAVMEVSAAVKGKEEHDEICFDILPQSPVKGVFAEKFENGNCTEDNLKENCADIHEKPEKGQTDEVNLGEIRSVIQGNPRNEVFGETSEQIPLQDGGPGMEDSLICSDILPGSPVKGVFAEKFESGNCIEDNLKENCAGIHEKPEKGQIDEVNLGEIQSVIHGNHRNEVFIETSEQIPLQGGSPELKDSLGNKDASVDEMEVSQGKYPLPVGGILGDKEVRDGSFGGNDNSCVVNESENGNFDEVDSREFHTGIQDKSVNGAFGEVHSGELNGQVQHQDENPETEDTSGNANSFVDEEIETSQGRSPSLVEAECCQDSQAQLLGDTQNGCSDHSQVNKESSNEPRVTEDMQKQDKKESFADKSAPSELLETDHISLQEYDSSSSTDEHDTLSIQHASVINDFSVNSADPPAPSRPAGLGSSTSLLESTPCALQRPLMNGTAPHRQSQLMEDPTNGETEEYDETREKLQMIRVKFLRLASRLGQTPHNVVVAQVLYRLGLAEQLRGSRNTTRVGAFSFDRASAMAEQLEAVGQEPLDFSCTIMVIGKTGVGKSATINSIFDEVKFSTDAFQLGTKKVQDIVGMVQGIKVRVIDTPGLLSSCLDQHQNRKILHSVKHFIKNNPPDIVLYLDRLDMQSRDYGDVPLLRTITDIFGPSVWFNAIIVLTHAASAPPEGPNGTPLSYEMFVTQRSHVVQQSIRQAAGDMRLMNPVSLVENHSACRTNRAGQRVLPNGQVWKRQLLLLSFASKILAEANTLLKLQDSPPGKPFGTRSKTPPLPFLLSSLLQSRPQLKLPEEQFGDEETIDDDLDESSDLDSESDYDELPPFKHLTKAQLEKLSKEQRRAYFDELDYREKLFMKKQLKEEKRRRKLLKKMAESAKDSANDYDNNLEEESGSTTSVPMPDMHLPSSFDSDCPNHRYRCLDNSNPWLVRPVLETHGWDHDVGYEGVNVERLFVVKDKIPISFSSQVTKDKKEANLQMELASSIKHGVGKEADFGFDIQTVGKDLAYTLRSDVRFSNFRCNKTAAGITVNILGDALATGLKLEDILLIHKRLRLVMTAGAMASRGDVAYGGTLEATLRDKDYPLGRMLSTLGLSIMDWHGDLAIGCNLQSQFPIGRMTNMIARTNLNNKGAGQVSIRLNSSEQLQIALVALIPIFRNIFKGHFFSSQSMQ